MVVVFVARETEDGELRVAATPESVKAIVRAGAQVRVEAGAGAGAGFQDADYASAGAELVATDGTTAEIVLKVRAPRTGEVARLATGTLLVCSLQPMLQLPVVRALAERQVTTFALDLMPRITRAQKMDVLSSQATAAGYQAVLLAAAALPKMFPLLMTAAGTLTPARVLVMGAGVAGLQAIATARRLGAQVEATDVRAAAREQVESLGARFVDTSGGQDLEGKGGYAKEATAEQLERQRATLKTHVAAADVVITTAAVPGRRAPVLLTADMVAAMKPGSVIVDLAVETGGNVEGSQKGERVRQGGVLIVGDADLASQKAADASRMFARNVLAFFELLCKKGQLQVAWDDECVQGTLVTKAGEVVHRGAAEALAAKGAS
jgi:NAD(P) transhydrogenase subunit alpha